MTYAAAAGFCVLSFAIGWTVGRRLLIWWFHQELDVMQKRFHEYTAKVHANNESVLKLLDELKLR
jgi:hypothetical protein